MYCGGESKQPYAGAAFLAEEDLLLLGSCFRSRAKPEKSVSKPKPKVILIAYYLRPSTEMGALRPTRFRKYLKAMGYACHVITATPQGTECPDDITVIPDELHEHWESGDRNHSFEAYIELFFRKLMFPGHMGILWAWKAAAACRKIVKENPRDRFVLVVSYPPIGTLLVGLLAGRRKRLPWIADFRDPLAALIVESQPGYSKFWTRQLEKRVFARADAIVANVEPAAVIWRERYPKARQKLHTIYNGYDPEAVPCARPIPPRGSKLLMHAGTFYHGRNADSVLESLARLRTQGTPEAESTKVFLLGVSEGDRHVNWDLAREAIRDGRLELHPPVGWQEWERIVGEADGLLLAQPHSTVQVPAKLYAYICIGRPILALLPHSSAVEPILQNSAVPHVIIYSDDGPQTIDRKLLEFLRLPNTATPINDWFRINFSAQHQAEELARIIDQVAQ